MADVARTALDGVRNQAHSLAPYHPYLGLRARLSQVWINKWTILILLVLARVLILIGNLKTDIASAEREALSACYSVQSSASAVASLPHYMAGGANELVAKTVEGAVSVLSDSLTLLITLLEAIFDFWIDMFLGTYECLFVFAVGGALSTVIGATEDVVNAVNDALGKVANEIEGDWNNFWTGLEGAVTPLTIGNPGWFDVLPKFDFNSSLNSLQHLSIPKDIQNDLNNLNNSIPNFQQVKSTTQGVVNIPFEYAKYQIETQFQQYKYDRSTFFVPDQKKLTFCDNQAGVTDFFDGLYHVAEVARKVFIGVLVTAATLACVPVAMMTIYEWNMIVGRARWAEDKFRKSGSMFETAEILKHPTMSKLGFWLAEKKKDEKKQTLMRWYVAYITSIPALILLSLAVAGLFACLCQYIIARAIQHEVPLLADRVIDYSTQVAEAVVNSSAQWAETTNAQIAYENAKFNNDIFGWVNVSTTAVNDTLNTFVDDTIKILNDTLGGTPLYNPVLDVFNCLIGYKIRGIETGLTWAKNHAYVTFPEFPIDLFSAGTTQILGSNITANVTAPKPSATLSPELQPHPGRPIPIIFPSSYSGFLPNLATEGADVSSPTPVPTATSTTSHGGFALTALPGFLSSEIGLSSLASATATAAPTPAANGSSISMAGEAISSDITKSVNALVDALYKGIKQEVWIASALLFLYFVVMFMGGIYVLWASHARDKPRSEGGPSTAGDIGDDRFPNSPDPAGPSSRNKFGIFQGVWPSRRSQSVPVMPMHVVAEEPSPPYPYNEHNAARHSASGGYAHSGDDDRADEKAHVHAFNETTDAIRAERERSHGQSGKRITEWPQPPQNNGAAQGRNQSAPAFNRGHNMSVQPGYNVEPHDTDKVLTQAMLMNHNRGNASVGAGHGGQRHPAPISGRQNAVDPRLKSVHGHVVMDRTEF